METINKICVIFVLLLIAIIVGYVIGIKGIINRQEVNVIDTTYNKVILDSIEYNIKRKDSIITNIKRNIKYEVEQANNVSDSVAVSMFKQLASE